MRIALYLAPLLVTAAACGTSKKAPDGSVASACTATASYGTVAPAAADQAAKKNATPPAQLSFDARANADAMYDDFSIQLFKGSGTYATGEIVAKTIPLTGAEVQYKDCGACFLIYTDVHPTDAGAASTDAYMATGGTLDITQVSPNLVGTLTSGTFAHVTIAADFTSTVVGDCSATVASFTFNTPVVMAFADSGVHSQRTR